MSDRDEQRDAEWFDLMHGALRLAASRVDDRLAFGPTGDPDEIF